MVKGLILLLPRIVLVLSLALASIHSGVSRAEARGAEALVICAEGGVRVVLIGADGKPVAHHHACPDCVTAGFALLAAMGALPQRVARGRRIARSKGAAQGWIAPLPRPRARAPPEKF